MYFLHIYFYCSMFKLNLQPIKFLRIWPPNCCSFKRYLSYSCTLLQHVLSCSHLVVDARGGEGGNHPPNNFSWSFHFEKWKHMEVFILRKRSTMTTTNNQHKRTKWHCLKTNKKQYSKFLIFWGSMPPDPPRSLVPLALTPPIFPEVSATAHTISIIMDKSSVPSCCNLMYNLLHRSLNNFTWNSYLLFPVKQS